MVKYLAVLVPALVAIALFLLVGRGRHEPDPTPPLPPASVPPAASHPAAPPTIAASALSGRAEVVDADTIGVAERRIRLFGIDAPERGQICERGGAPWSCGHEATAALSRLLADREVRCEERDRDRNRRIVAVCWVDGRDVSRWLVEQGWALAYRRFALDYADAEDAARLAGRGIWAGTFDTPEEWRRQRRRTGRN